MIYRLHRRQRGFSLVELSIVLGIIFIIVAGIWTYAVSAKRTAKIQQSFQAIGDLVDATRVTYTAATNIGGGVGAVVPKLVLTNSVPAYLVRTASTTCGGVSGLFLNSPLVTNTTACGTASVCDWVYGAQAGSVCAASDAKTSQYFAVEFNNLDYPSCIDLVERVTQTLPATGLIDIYINTHSAIGQLGGIPVPVNAASSKSPANLGCTVNSSTNTLDFIYELRAPST